jgi:HK97 gp10 family phage protein
MNADRQLMSVEFIDNSKEVLRDVTVLSHGQFTEFLETAREVAKSLAPVQYGTLRNSIDFEDVTGELNYIFFTRAGYGAFQELGTSKMAGKHFMQSGLQAASRELTGKLHG